MKPQHLFLSVLLVFVNCFASAQYDSTKIHKVTYVIETRPQGAKLYIDSQYVATTPCACRITNGNHYFVLLKNGQKPLQKNMLINGNNNTSFRLKDSLKVPRFALRIQPNFGEVCAFNNKKGVFANNIDLFTSSMSAIKRKIKRVGGIGGITLDFSFFLNNHNAINLGYLYNITNDYHDEYFFAMPSIPGDYPSWDNNIRYNKFLATYSHYWGNINKRYFLLETGLSVSHLSKVLIVGDDSPVDHIYPQMYNPLLGIGLGHKFFSVGYRQTLFPAKMFDSDYTNPNGVKMMYRYGYFSIDVLNLVKSITNRKPSHTKPSNPDKNVVNKTAKTFSLKNTTFVLNMYPWQGYTRKEFFPYSNYDAPIKKFLFTNGLALELTTFFTPHHAINLGYMLNFRRNQYSDDKIPMLYSYYLRNTRLGDWNVDAGFIFNNGHNEGTKGNVLFGLGWAKIWFKAGYRQSLSTPDYPKVFVGYGYVACDVLKLLHTLKNQ